MNMMKFHLKREDYPVTSLNLIKLLPFTRVNDSIAIAIADRDATRRDDTIHSIKK